MEWECRTRLTLRGRAKQEVHPSGWRQVQGGSRQGETSTQSYKHGYQDSIVGSSEAPGSRLGFKVLLLLVLGPKLQPGK